VDALRLVDGWRPGDRGLYLWSEATGCGKSHLVYALVQRELHAGRRVVALEWTDFLSRVKATFNRKAGGQTEADVDAEVEHADLLVIDDLGAGRPTEWSTEKLWSLVNARYLTKRALIVTSNYDPGMLRRVLGAPEGARIGSRLDAMCRAVRVRGADMRGAETAERVRWQARGEGT
jgi:DNA replication protein DnaC